MSIITKEISYELEGKTFIGLLAYDQSTTLPRPGVLVFHDWSGINDFAKEKAIDCAKKGYVGFAVDMYGDGKCGQTVEEKSALMMPLVEDRKNLQKRTLKALAVLNQQNQVNANQTAAMGFCFGGMCVLDLARSGADINAVISIHGLLTSPDAAKSYPVKASVLVLHGIDDPMVDMNAFFEFSEEMKRSKADYQLHGFGQTKHAFTNPNANDVALGTVFCPKANKRSFQLIDNFLEEAFVN